jgi:hypothetical protein
MEAGVAVSENQKDVLTLLPERFRPASSKTALLVVSSHTVLA